MVAVILLHCNVSTHADVACGVRLCRPQATRFFGLERAAGGMVTPSVLADIKADHTDRI